MSSFSGKWVRFDQAHGRIGGHRCVVMQQSLKIGRIGQWKGATRNVETQTLGNGRHCFVCIRRKWMQTTKRPIRASICISATMNKYINIEFWSRIRAFIATLPNKRIMAITRSFFLFLFSIPVAFLHSFRPAGHNESKNNRYYCTITLFNRLINSVRNR